MFKVIACLFCGLFATAIFGADIYDVKLTCKATQIKHTDSVFYKDAKTITYKGFLKLDFAEDGSVEPTADLVVYGDFSDGKGVRSTTVDIGVMNRIGKNLQKCQVYMNTDFGSFAIAMAGNGKIKTVPTNITACGDSCGDIVRIDSASGDITGAMQGIVCDPCDGNPWAFEFNYCDSAELIPSDLDAVFGQWSMRYNSGLTKSCADTSFEDCVMAKIPKRYLTVVE